MKRILAALLACLMIFALASCGSTEEETATTEETELQIPDGDSETLTEAEETSTSDEETTATDEASATEETSATDKDASTTKAGKESGVPKTAEEILAAYTVVMNKAKTDKVGFTKSEWQELPSDENSRQVSKGTTLVNAALGVANNFMTSEEKAKSNPDVYEKGGDMAEFPIRNTPYGCTLTDTSVLKTITCEELPNGNYKIHLVLKDEANAEPAPNGTGDSPSFHGRVITPVSKKEIDENLSGGVVSAVAKDITYNLLFHDTESTVVYNPKTNEIVTLEQITRVRVSGSGKIAGMEIVVDKQELINTNEIYNLVY